MTEADVQSLKTLGVHRRKPRDSNEKMEGKATVTPLCRLRNETQ